MEWRNATLWILIGTVLHPVIKLQHWSSISWTNGFCFINGSQVTLNLGGNQLDRFTCLHHLGILAFICLEEMWYFSKIVIFRKKKPRLLFLLERHLMMERNVFKFTSGTLAHECVWGWLSSRWLLFFLNLLSSDRSRFIDVLPSSAQHLPIRLVFSQICFCRTTRHCF